jgi:prevent-host-death family protein
VSEQAWPLYDAKNKFSALVETAREHGPQTVTKHGRPSVVVISVEDFERLSNAQRGAPPKARLVDWLFSGPRAALPGRPARRRTAEGISASWDT